MVHVISRLFRRSADRVGAAPIPRRPLGRTGREVSALGVGCAPLGRVGEFAAVRIMRRALDLGIDYFDVASTYHDAELKLGRALRGRREQAFIATKVLQRGRAEAAAELTRSRHLLGLEVIDLLQLHGVNTMSDLDEVTRAGGALDAVDQARRDGRVRHVGISGHRDPAVIVAALDRYDFASVLIPVSLADSHINDFEPLLKPLCRERGVAVIQMKILASSHLTRAMPAREAMRWAFARPDHAVSLVGIGRMKELMTAAETITRAPAPSQEESRGLRERARAIANSGLLWWKK
jgi:aryl-alcohol dehydrogenase-like predicted oxidoreductase